MVEVGRSEVTSNTSVLWMKMLGSCMVKAGQGLVELIKSVGLV